MSLTIRAIVFDREGNYMEEGIHGVSQDYLNSFPIGYYAVLVWDHGPSIYVNSGRTYINGERKPFWDGTNNYPSKILPQLALLGIGKPSGLS